MKKKNLIFSIAQAGYSKLFKGCLESQQEYSEKFGFEYVLVDESPRRLLAAEAAWLKVFLLKSALLNGYEWVAFLDADCELRDHAPSFVDDFQVYEKEKKIFMAHGFSGRINSGVIFLKNSIEALSYLEEIICHKEKSIPHQDRALYENGHFIFFGKNNPYVQIIKSEEWNNNTKLNLQSYIQHYSGGILRKFYLETHPLLRLRYILFKNLEKICELFLKRNEKTSMAQMENLLPFYFKKYQNFTKG